MKRLTLMHHVLYAEGKANRTIALILFGMDLALSDVCRVAVPVKETIKRIGERIDMNAATDDVVWAELIRVELWRSGFPIEPERKYQGRFRHNCQTCGRFVSAEDANVVYDYYLGGWEADPHCPKGKGCRK